MYGRCRGPIWKYDDFSDCIRNDYILSFIPILICAVSVVLLSLSIVIRLWKTITHKAGKEPLYDSSVGSDASPSGGSGSSATAVPEEDEEENDVNSNEHITLHRTVSNVSKTRMVEDNPKAQRSLVFLESLLVLSQLGIIAAIVATNAWGRTGAIAAASELTAWIYVSLLVLGRLVQSLTQFSRSPLLWYHTAWLYAYQFVSATIVLRFYLIRSPSGLAAIFSIVSFAIDASLLLIALCSRKGNRTVNLEYEGDLLPAKEPLASVISRITFSWIDPLIWAGYRGTLELTDVWNLPMEDKAARVVRDYRQVKKTSALAWHLLKYFKRSLILQAAWSCGSGVLIFLPTLLIRAILQYLEDPLATPRSNAWLWVTLLFLSGCASAVADGQALWVGRKVCIRLRSIIVGEIYVKALKRRTGASIDKVLGQEKASGKNGSILHRLVRATQLGKKNHDDENDNSQNHQPDSRDADAGSEAETPSQSIDPAASGSQVTSGTIINLMAVDSFKVSEVCAYLHFLWASTPVQFILSIILLYKVLGPSSLAGIGTMILVLPINMYIAGQFTAAQKRILAATDARIHITNEVLSNIRVVKYFAWEHRFMDAVEEKRSTELKNIRYRFIVWALSATLWGTTPIIITFFSFAFYTLAEKKPLIPSVAFTALSLFNILRIPLDQLADMVAHVQEARVSVDRIEEFLSEEETSKYEQLGVHDAAHDQHTMGFLDCTCTWASQGRTEEDSAGAFRLLDLRVNFSIGSFNVIAGPTGSGKTSMLMALLGEMTLLKGEIRLPGACSREDLTPNPETGLTENVAYCAQQAWLVNDTVKQNILFASPWDRKRYKAVVKACRLEKDFEILDAGDETLVGEKGVTLSGGQKQRISLARALYSPARHLLLDDILSAVDSHTASWIFENAIMGPLMYNRTCILVTHNIALCLPHAQFAVYLENGRVVSQGSAMDVMNSGKIGQELSTSNQPSHAPSTTGSPKPRSMHEGSQPSLVPNGSLTKVATDELTLQSSRTKHALTNDDAKEGKAEGRVQWNVMSMYFQAMGPWFFWVFAIFAFLAAQVASVATNVWIRQWANSYVVERIDAWVYNRLEFSSYQHLASYRGPIIGSSIILPRGSSQGQLSSLDSVNKDRPSEAYYLGIYAALGCAFALVTYSRDRILFAGSLSASRKIHQRLIESVCHARFRFFDSTPLGQIMNRFSKDVQNVDQDVAPVAVGFVHCFVSIVTVVILISVITPGFLIAGIFITLLYYLIGRFYISSSRDLKRLESVQRSPLYQQFGETLSGMTTIRAYNDERRFIRENLSRINIHNRPFIYLWATNRWLAFRVDIAGALVSFFSGVFVILAVGNIDSGSAGLALTYAVTFTENVLWFVRLYSTNEQNMNSVERIKEYLDVEQEAPPIVPDRRPPGDWPTEGVIEFAGYSTRYRNDFDLVLKDLTFRIHSCEKVGIVGRTGAGKSSLALAMFRALEAETGRILIDGLDVGLIGLKDLREAVVMVPQDPTLFSGTIRSNLDPFNLLTDEEIFTALRRVQLIDTKSSAQTPATPSTPTFGLDMEPNSSPHAARDTFRSRPTVSPGAPPEDATSRKDSPPENRNMFVDLGSPIAESGTNLSQGQRQLLCLARALLKDPKILIMDEATASIDYATDAKIQETIRDLKDNTIVTIAHRLKTIVDYDKVIVMDEGRVVEMGDPWELLRPMEQTSEPSANEQQATKKRWFREMCVMSGELEILEAEANRSWEARRLISET